MADEEELYLGNLDEFVIDEDKIVTYKWLSRTLSVPANKAKQMLYAFVQKQKLQKFPCHLNITYIVGGRCSFDGDVVHRYVITQDKDLEETKKSFSLVTSLHIYSVQKCRLKDSNSLFTVDYDIQQLHKTEDNSWSHICCSAAKRRTDNGVHRVSQNVNGVTNDGKKISVSKMVNGEAESGHSSKDSSTTGTLEQNGNLKTSSSKSRKGQISAIEMFVTKPSSSKTDKSNIKKGEDAEDNKEDKVCKSKVAQTKDDKPGGMKSFFGQKTTVKKTSEKSAPASKSNDGEVSTENKSVSERQDQLFSVQSDNQKKREVLSDDEEEPLPAEISKAVKAKSKASENTGSKESKKEVQKKEQQENKTEHTKSNKARKKKAVITESDEETEEKPKKRRRRMKELPKESSEDEETVSSAESKKKISADQEFIESESPLPQQQQQQIENDTGRPRKRKRVLTSKTFMNGEGYMVTEKVWESDSTDASDDEPQITKPLVKHEKRPSPVKKTTKKTHSDMKSKGVKQSSLTSFFKKS